MSFENDLLVQVPHLRCYARALTGDVAWSDEAAPWQQLEAPAEKMTALELQDV